MSTNLGSCAILFLSSIERQYWTRAFLLVSFGYGLNGLLCRRMSPNCTLRCKVDLLRLIAQARDFGLVLRDRGIFINCSRSIWTLLHPQFFVFRWQTSTTPFYERVVFVCYHIRFIVRVDMENTIAISLMALFWIFLLTLFSKVIHIDCRSWLDNIRYFLACLSCNSSSSPMK